MWFFTGKRVTEADDPVFGTIRFDRRRERWKGQMNVPGFAADLAVTIEAGDAGPSDRQRMIATSFAEAFSGLLPSLQSAVLDHYRRVRDAWRDAVQPPLCAACGYDLREASDRCPECGTTVELPEVSDAGHLWSSLTLRELAVIRDRNPSWPELELMLDFDAPWDEEHGLQLAIGGNELLEVRDE